MTTSTARIAIIGVGNLGTALARGWLRLPEPPSLVVYDRDETRVQALVAELNGRAGAAPVRAARSLPELAQSAEFIVVSVKPTDMQGVLHALGAVAGHDRVVISTAAGVTLARVRDGLGPGAEVYRIMPNLAVAVGEGVIALAPEAGTATERVHRVEALLGHLGAVEILPEELFDAVTALQSAPAFLAIVMEGLEDGAVRTGIPRHVARPFVQQMAVGTARLLFEEGLTASQLKDRVSSPGGTTIAGIAVMEDRGVRGALLRAVEAAAERGRQL